jgi:hypothetical protein
MSQTKTVHMSSGRSVENESIWKEKPSSPSRSLLYPCLLPHFCFRHFYLSTKLGLTISFILNFNLTSSSSLHILVFDIFPFRRFSFLPFSINSFPFNINSNNEKNLNLSCILRIQIKIFFLFFE